MRSEPEWTASVEIGIVGAGPAGLSAALYAARYLRTTLVLHDGTSRATHIPCTYNVPGFADGITGTQLLERMSRHAARYGAEFMEARIERLERRPDGSFALTSGDGRSWSARSVILATGIEHNHLPMDEACHAAASECGALRYCPVCDGYEHRDQRVGVVGCDASGAAEALFLRKYSPDVTLLALHDVELTQRERRDLAAAGVPTLAERVEGFALEGRAMRVRLAGRAAPLDFDVLYPALGSRPRSALAQAIGVADEDGKIAEDAPRRTSVAGVFCAGDLVDGLDQISVAMGQGALAATSAHNGLRQRDGETAAGVGVRPASD